MSAKVEQLLFETLASLEQPLSRYRIMKLAENAWKKRHGKKPRFQSYIYVLFDKFEESGYLTVARQPWRKGEKRTLKKGLCHLSFKGFIIYLSSIPQPEAPVCIGKPGETLEELKKRAEIKKRKYVKDIQRLVKITENYGRILGYPIFSECKFLMESLGISFLYWLLGISNIMLTNIPVLTNISKHADSLKKQEKKLMNEIQKTPDIPIYIFHKDSNGKTERTEHNPVKEMKEEIQHLNKWFKLVRTKEDELLRRFFAQHFFERLAMISRKEMPNENLHGLATLVLKKNMQTIENLETAVSLFKV